MDNKETKKMTEKEIYTIIKEEMSDNEIVVSFCEKKMLQLERKASSKTQTKTQKENEELKEVIVKALRELGKPSTITEIQSRDEILVEKSNQKMSALLGQLVKSEVVIRDDSNRKQTLFSLVENDTEEVE